MQPLVYNKNMYIEIWIDFLVNLRYHRYFKIKE